MKTRPNKSVDKAAFTLLEITVAIAVFGFVMISVVGCWKSIITGTRIAQEAAAEA